MREEMSHNLEPYYQEEGITVYCGDCLEEMPKIPDETIDMVMADPPYGTTACRWDSIIPLEPVWKQLKRVTKKKSTIAMTASQPFTTILISSNMKMFKYEWIWDKNTPTGFLNAKRAPLKQHESICIFARNKYFYNPQMVRKAYNGFRSDIKHKKNTQTGGVYRKIISKGNRSNYRYPKTILGFQGLSGWNAGEHPTQKPVALMEYLIKTYTNEGEMVLDFCMGSGTTLVAAKNLNRKAIGIEKEEKYCELAVNRIKQQNRQGCCQWTI